MAIGGGRRASLYWLNFAWLASSFRARAAVESKSNGAWLESDCDFRAVFVVVPALSPRMWETKLFPAPEL